jgi:solute carrier family 25 (mitochondrial carnitine/acylcarnitine transporter), member 20/29
MSSASAISKEWLSDFVAGWLSGAVSILACQPVDTILTRWQAASPMIPTSAIIATGAAGISISKNKRMNNWREITIDLYRTLGPRALWRGATPVIVATPIQNALLMSGYGFGTRYYSFQIDGHQNENSSQLSRRKQLGAIFVGGCTGGM